MDEHYDWTRFEIVFYYDQDIATVFRAWATAAGLASFFIDRASFRAPDGHPRAADEIARTGDRYEWTWRHGHSIAGEITSATEPAEIAFTFGDMHVSVRFATVGDQTEVHLVQTRIAETAAGRAGGHLNCRSCWIFFMTNLKSVLATGTDLRDADPARVSSMEVGFVPLSQAPPGA